MLINAIKKIQTNLLVKLAICFTFLMIILFVGNEKISNSGVMAASKDKLYLSDMQYMDNSHAASGHLIKTDKNDSDKMIELKVNDESRTFVKGVTAWASSEIIYDLRNYDFDYFKTFLGVDISEQSDYFNTGVKFTIYTSKDNTNWDKKYESEIMYGWSNAKEVSITITGEKYLKLVAYKNSENWWAEWYDEAVYADAKLVKERYKEIEDNAKVDFIKTVQEYDEAIKNYVKKGSKIEGDFELALLQREFVKNVDYKILLDFVKCDEDYMTTVKWLMTSLENMRLYIYGGEPDGNYISSLQALTKLYTAHKDDLDIKEKTIHGTVKGELYRKMMITLSLTHSAQVALWMDTTSPENQSDPVVRYEIFKQLHENDQFIISKNEDGTTKYDYTAMFESLKVEEMRYVLNNIIDDEEIIWLNEYTQYYIDQNPNKEEEFLQPHHYMKYIWPDYAREEFHDPDKKDFWDEKYRYPFTQYRITYKPNVYKLWMNIEGGAVCGGISKIGSNIRGVHGAPSSVISQPGHAALIYYRKDSNGNGYWTIDNDVSGWAQSGKTEKLAVRMPLGWGSDDYVEGWAASYIVLAQEALNHYDDYVRSMQKVYLANSFEGDSKKQEELYREALEIQSYNIDAWNGLIKLYEKDENKSQEEYYKLATEMAEKLKAFPLPMYNLTNLIGKHLVSNEYKFKFTMLQTSILTEGSELPNESNLVMQPSITRTVAKFLLGQMDTELAKFSFDGEDAGSIVLSDKFDGVGIHWDYTVNGKSNNSKDYTDVTFTADEDHKRPLTDEELSKINAENDIYVHIVGTSYDDVNLYKIDITGQDNLEVYANDMENRLIGVKENTQWRYYNKSRSGEEEEWTTYLKASPDLSGNKTIQIRQPASGTMMASEPATYHFEEDSQTLKRRYVPVSHLSIEDVSSEEPGHAGQAANTIDGNYNTRWHSNWNGKDSDKFIIIKTDEPIYLSAVEYVPAGGGNGRLIDATIYGSMDGKTWVELSKREGLTYVGNQNDIDFGKNNIKSFEVEDSQEVQYIKISGDRTSTAGGGSFMTARMFNIYEDVEKNPHITAGIAYSTTNPTNGNVEARLVNTSVEVEITNNDGKDTYEFTDNDTFTFEFVDKATHKKKGKIEAKVDWIDREAPTATVEYSTTDPTYEEVLARLIPSEDVTVTNNAHNENNEEGKAYIFKTNGKFTYEFTDAAGNSGTAIAHVNWIRSTSNPYGDPNNPDGPEIFEPLPDVDEPESGEDETGKGETGEGETEKGDEGNTTPGTTVNPGEDEGQDNKDDTEEKDETPGLQGDTEEKDETPGLQDAPGTENDTPGDQNTPGTGNNNSEGQGSSSNSNNQGGTGTTSGTQGNQGGANSQTSGNQSGTGTTGATSEAQESQDEADSQTSENQDNLENQENLGTEQNNSNVLKIKDIDNTVKDKTLPQTGEKVGKIILISLISIAFVFSVVFYIKKKRS